jgi:hypothetical protein
MARRRETTLESPLYNAPPRPPVECQACHGLFEAPFEVDGVKVRGHVPGGPNCPGKRKGDLTGAERDARVRRAKLAGR